MIDSSNDFQIAVNADSRTFRARLFYAGTEIEGDIRKLVIHKGSCGSSAFVPGAVFSSYIEAVIDGCATPLEGKELELMIGIMVNHDLSSPVFDWIRIGYYTVGKPYTSSYRTSFTAYSRIAVRFSSFVENIPVGLTLSAIAAQLETDSGVTICFDSGIDTSLSLTNAFVSEAVYPGLSLRDALGVLAKVIGGYAAETSDGTVRITKYGHDVNVDCRTDIMITAPAFHDYNSQITGVQVTVSEGAGGDTPVTYSSGTPVNLEQSCKYMTEGAFAEYSANLIGLSWRGGQVELALGDPRLEAWDTLRVTDAGGNAYIMPCMDIVHTFDGGIKTRIEAPSIEAAAQTENTLDRIVRIVSSTRSLSQSTYEAVQKDFRYIVTYTVSGNLWTFTAALTHAGTDITEDVEASNFLWYKKTQAGKSLLGIGPVLIVDVSTYEYGGAVVGVYSDEINVVTLSGETVVFDSGNVLDLLNIVAEINAEQAGSGDPSGTNVRPITGFDDVNLVHSPTTDAQDGTTYTISLASAGTVYGGTLNVSAGTLTVNRVAQVIGESTLSAFSTWYDADTSRNSWGLYINSSDNSWITQNHLGPKPISADFISDTFKKVGGIYANENIWGATISFSGTNLNYFGMRIPKSILPTVSSHAELTAAAVAYFKANPATFVWEIEPQTYSLTPTQIAMFTGTNRFWADSGDVSVTLLQEGS